MGAAYEELLLDLVAEGVEVISQVSQRKRHEVCAAAWKARFGPMNLYEPITESDLLLNLCRQGIKLLDNLHDKEDYQAMEASGRLIQAFLGAVMPELTRLVNRDLALAHAGVMPPPCEEIEA